MINILKLYVQQEGEKDERTRGINTGEIDSRRMYRLPDTAPESGDNQHLRPSFAAPWPQSQPGEHPYDALVLRSRIFSGHF